MRRDEFVKMVGDQLIHVTLAGNLAGIRALGLLRPVTLAARGRIAPGALILRNEALTFEVEGHPVTLNHQKPLRAGRNHDFIDGQRIADWSDQLDRRIFFWPGRRWSRDFARSLDDRGATQILRLDAGGLFDRLGELIDLSPINSGNATRRPARRGDWLYVPATAPANALRDNRKRRGLTGSTDQLVEVSLRGDLEPDLLAALLR